MKTTTIAALFVASVLLIGVAAGNPAYAGIGTSPGPLNFWQMFFDFGGDDKIVISNGYTNEFKGEVSFYQR
jgi:hypothetical protein